jgi:hypothetical protein
MRSFLAIFVNGCIAVWLVGVGPLCWILRDGLGPNSVDTVGSGALVRFLMTFWWGPVLAGLILARLALSRRRAEARPHQA